MPRPRTPLIATSAAILLAGAATVGGLIDFGAPNLDKVREKIGGPRPFVIANRVPSPERGMLSFIQRCEQVTTEGVDPIVAPHGMSHDHDFMGNPEAADASTTLAAMAASPVRCRITDDRSGYWTPTAFQGTEQLKVTQNLIYYKGTAFTDSLNEVKPIPFGLHMIAGNAGASKNQDREVGFWQFPDNLECENCVASNNSMGKNAMISAPTPRPLQLRINFPNCWNGDDLDSPDHKSHVAYAKRGKCPSSHPVKIAQLVWFITYENTTGGPGFRLSSGPWHTFHADFVNLWEPHTMETLTNVCIKAAQRCRNIFSDNVDRNLFWGSPAQFDTFWNRADYRHTPEGSPPPPPVDPPPPPPADTGTVQAGRDRTIRAAREFSLKGAATINGQRLSPQTDHRGNGSSVDRPRLVWRQLGGPRRGVRIQQRNRTVTAITGAGRGTYLFELSLTAGTVTAADRVSVVVR